MGAGGVVMIQGLDDWGARGANQVTSLACLIRITSPGRVTTQHNKRL